MPLFSSPPRPTTPHHPLPVTAVTAALLALLAVRLAMRVIRVRRADKIPYQSDNRDFVKRQRALANLCEYAPFGLALLGLLEAGGAQHATVVCPLATAFLFGRLAHAASMGWDADFKWRVRGTGATLLSLQAGAAVLLARVGMAALAARKAA